ncbi:MAG: hypothetical protein V4692_01260 [Bdellovibrionota bacterium]
MISRMIFGMAFFIAFQANAANQPVTRHYQAEMKFFNRLKFVEYTTTGYFIDIQDIKAGKIWHTVAFDEPIPPHRTIIAFDHSTRLPNGQWQQEYGVIKGKKEVVPAQVMITNGELKRMTTSRPLANNDRLVVTTIYKDGGITGTSEHITPSGSVIGGGSFTTKPISAEAYQAGLTKVSKKVMPSTKKALPSNK